MYAQSRDFQDLFIYDNVLYHIQKTWHDSGMDDRTDEASSHYLHSVLRERIVEHVFVGDALRRL
jgi:hypothetical protein